MIAILTEHTGGKWPFWLSPRQITIVPVAAPFFEYGTKIRDMCRDAGLWAEVDATDSTLPKKIRNAEISGVNFIFVVGADEAKVESVNVRGRDDVGKVRGEVRSFEVVLKALVALREAKAGKSTFQVQEEVEVEAKSNE
jgi:threonyl-tRNA synthetase